MRVMLLGQRLKPLLNWKAESHGHNFWLDMIPLIKQRVEKVVVASIAGRPVQNGGVEVATAIPFENEEVDSNYFLKTATFGLAFPWLLSITKKYGIDVLHLIDNFGPVQVLFHHTNITKTISQLQYEPRYPIYDGFLRFSLRPFDAVVTGSGAIARKLEELSIAPKTILPIPWAVSANHEDNPDQQLADKRALGLQEYKKIVLWSGFITNVVGIKELEFSVKLVKQLIDRTDDVAFVFAFKRTHFRSEYKRLEEPRIRVVSLASKAEFLRIARVSTLLLSPCLNYGSVLSPPLTWLECMAAGVPVATTRIPGVEEAVLDGKSGLLFEASSQAVDTLLRLLGNPGKMEELTKGARQMIKKKFGLNQAADAYIKLWSHLSPAS